MLIDATISGDRNVIKKEAEKILKYFNRNIVHLECKNKSDISNNRGNWNQCKIIHKIPEHHIVKAHNWETTKKKAILATAHIFRK